MGFRVMLFLIVLRRTALLREETDLGAGRRRRGGRRTLTADASVILESGAPSGRPFYVAAALFRPRGATG